MTSLINATVHIKIYTYIDFGAKNNDKDVIFKVGHDVKVSRYKKNIFGRVCNINWSEKTFQKIN